MCTTSQVNYNSWWNSKWKQIIQRQFLFVKVNNLTEKMSNVLEELEQLKAQILLSETMDNFDGRLDRLSHDFNRLSRMRHIHPGQIYVWKTNRDKSKTDCRQKLAEKHFVGDINRLEEPVMQLIDSDRFTSSKSKPHNKTGISKRFQVFLQSKEDVKSIQHPRSMDQPKTKLMPYFQLSQSNY